MNEYLPYVGLASLALSAAMALLKVFGWSRGRWHAWRDRRLLETRELAESYTREQLRNATQSYVQPDSSSIDPSREAEIRMVVGARQPIFEAMDQCLANPKYRHFLVLADSGMGKTAFVLNYYARSIRGPRKARRKVAVVPLGQKHADKQIEAIPHKSSTVLILDAFDEDTRAIEDHRARLAEIMDLASEFERVVMTCRTQFFLSDEEIPKRAGVVEVGVRTAGQQRRLEFHKLYLQPLTDEQVQAYLRLRYPGLASRSQRRRVWERVRRLPDLSCRPMLLTYLPELLGAGTVELDSAYRLYDELVARWIERDGDWFSGKHEEVLKLSVDLAVDLWKSRQARGGELIAHAELETMARGYALTLKEQKLVSARSLLNRIGDGYFKFAHRSILEFLVVKARLTGRNGAGEGGWSDQMQMFLREALMPGAPPGRCPADFPGASMQNANLRGADLRLARLPDATLRGADLGGACLRGANLEGADLGEVDLESADLKGAQLKGANLQGANLQHAMLGYGYSGGAWRGDGYSEGADLGGADLREAKLQGANLLGAKLPGANLEGANLEGMKFKGTDIRRANLRGANLRNALLGDDYGENARLDEADLENADLRGAKLQRVGLESTKLKGAQLRGANLWGATICDGSGKRDDLRGADLQGVILEDAKLEGADLREVSLEGAILRGVRLRGADLQDAKLPRVGLQDADLRDANLEKATLQAATLTGADLRGAKLRRADLRDAVLGEGYEGSLHGLPGKITNLAGADLEGADLQNARLQCVNLQDANLRDAKLEGAALQGAYLQGAKAEGASFQGANLQGAKLKGASFRGASFQNADLLYTDLDGSTLQGANLQGAKIQQRPVKASASTETSTE